MKADEYAGKFTGGFDMNEDVEELEIGDEVCFLVKGKVTGYNRKAVASGVKLDMTFKTVDAASVSSEFYNKFAQSPKSTARETAVYPTEEDNGPEPEPPEPDYPEPIVDVVREEKLTKDDVVMVDEEEEDEVFKPGVESKALPRKKDKVLARFLEVQ